MKEKITLYTDGGCRPNPGPGGWGVVVLRVGEDPEDFSGSEAEATNNRMELRAAIEGLKAVSKPHIVDLHTDSEYLRKGVTTWIEGWKKRGWRTAGGSAVLNRDLWQELEVALERHEVHWHWIRGHSGDRWNERADRLASAAIPRDEGLVDDEKAVHVVLAVAYSGKNKRGAWAAMLRFGSDEKDLVGTVEGASANQMHILGAAHAFEAMKRPVRAHVYTTSDYLKDGATAWLSAWKNRGWRTREGKAVSNRDAWQRLDLQLDRHRLEWHVFGRNAGIDEMEGVKSAAKAALSSPPE